MSIFVILKKDLNKFKKKSSEKIINFIPTKIKLIMII